MYFFYNIFKLQTVFQVRNRTIYKNLAVRQSFPGDLLNSNNFGRDWKHSPNVSSPSQISLYSSFSFWMLLFSRKVISVC